MKAFAWTPTRTCAQRAVAHGGARDRDDRDRDHPGRATTSSSPTTATSTRRAQPLLHVTKRKLRQYPIWFGSGCFHTTDLGPRGGGAGPALLRGRRAARPRQRRVQARRARRAPEADRVQPPLHGGHRAAARRGRRPAAVRLQQAHGPAAAADRGLRHRSDDVVPDARRARVARVPPPRRDHDPLVAAQRDAPPPLPGRQHVRHAPSVRRTACASSAACAACWAGAARAAVCRAAAPSYSSGSVIHCTSWITTPLGSVT